MKSTEWCLSEDTLKSIISRIQQRYEEEKRECNNDYEQGVADGLGFAIDMIKNDLEGRNLNAEDFGIQ